jgi:hypothetical protein
MDGTAGTTTKLLTNLPPLSDELTFRLRHGCVFVKMAHEKNKGSTLFFDLSHNTTLSSLLSAPVF